MKTLPGNPEGYPENPPYDDCDDDVEIRIYRKKACSFRLFYSDRHYSREEDDHRLNGLENIKGKPGTR